LSDNRFIRDYELVITLPNNEAVEIKPELRVQFQITKSIRGGLNSCALRVYNLNEDKRMKIVKNKQNNLKMIKFLFKAGYKNNIGLLFKGNVWNAYSIKQGADFITIINSLDGGYDMINSFTSKTINGGNYIEHILADMPNTQKGALTNLKKLFRPKVLVGNSHKLIEENMGIDETFFIENEKLYVMKDNEVIGDLISLVSPETGLIQTPVIDNQQVTFKTLLNPSIKIGHRIQLESSAKWLNGVYKVITIKYTGDNYGNDWTQEVTCYNPVITYKVLK